MNKWQQLLGEIKRARTTFDNSSTQKGFGPIIIDYAQVQSSVNNKYDYWHKDVISNFGIKLNDSMKVRDFSGVHQKLFIFSNFFVIYVYIFIIIIWF